ncbi:MAG TPA: cohesin domain-containing protein, partial [Clostridia bacterium]
MRKVKVILCVLLALLTGLANLGGVYASSIDSSVSKPSSLTVNIGKVSGGIGDTVTVPVTFNNLNSKLNNCDFVLSYDNNAVELTSVKAGDIVTNPSVNFCSNISSGKVAILFVDESQGSQPISHDGVFAILVFKIKSGFSNVQLKELGSFNDPDLRDIAVKFLSDTIITPTPVPTPTPSPTPSVITSNPLVGKNMKIQLT